MMRGFRRKQLGWLLIGLLVGLGISGVLPHTPLHAVATDRADSTIICTCPVEEGIEAICFLDSLTGILRAAVPYKTQNGGFQSTWQTNVSADLGAAIRKLNTGGGVGHGKRAAAAGPRQEITAPQTPKYLMTSGMIDINITSARSRAGKSLIYVAEANTGVVLAYVIPWSYTSHTAGQAFHNQPLSLWAADQFSSAVIRMQE